ncbi:hypothetical protein [Streptomyces sp. NPDC021224]|uniref:hypothetical protein n=1 Tax=unclassified Streptomyces TaxID=2593676 RepID=UPI0037B6789B
MAGTESAPGATSQRGTPVPEEAGLEGGPADGLRVRVAGRPQVLQVTVECPVVGDGRGLQVSALHVYRRRGGLPLSYGWDGASP